MGGDMVGNDGLALHTLSRLRNVVAAFRSIEQNLPAAYIDTFLAVALKPGQGPTDYAMMLGTLQPSASRLLGEIGGHPRTRATALHLVEAHPHPESRRNIMYYLTPKGYALAYRVGGMLQGRSESQS